MYTYCWQLSWLDKPDAVAVGIFYDGNQFATADILNILLHLRASIQELLHALLDVGNVPVADGTGQAFFVAVGVQGYVLTCKGIANVIRLVNCWFYTQKFGVKGLRLSDVFDGVDDRFETLIHCMLL